MVWVKACHSNVIATPRPYFLISPSSSINWEPSAQIHEPNRDIVAKNHQRKVAWDTDMKQKLYILQVHRKWCLQKYGVGQNNAGIMVCIPQHNWEDQCSCVCSGSFRGVLHSLACWIAMAWGSREVGSWWVEAFPFPGVEHQYRC